jgi:hypothetical protein
MRHDLASMMAKAVQPAPRDFSNTVEGAYQPQGMGHLNQANAEMGLSPQEQLLYMRHLLNMNNGQGFTQPDGSRSTLLAGTHGGPDGREYVLPSVYDGRQVSPQQSISRAVEQGLENFPSYPTWQEGEARYGRMHDFMSRDMDY